MERKLFWAFRFYFMYEKNVFFHSEWLCNWKESQQLMLVLIMGHRCEVNKPKRPMIYWFSLRTYSFILSIGLKEFTLFQYKNKPKKSSMRNIYTVINSKRELWSAIQQWMGDYCPSLLAHKTGSSKSSSRGPTDHQGNQRTSIHLQLREEQGDGWGYTDYNAMGDDGLMEVLFFWFNLFKSLTAMEQTVRPGHHTHNTFDDSTFVEYPISC